LNHILKTIHFLTAASSNHFKSVCQFIQSYLSQRLDTDLKCDLTFFDLGLSPDQVQHIKTQYLTIEYEVFDWGPMPEFGNSISKPCAGAYAWKPQIIKIMKDLHPDSVLIWCDGGNKLNSDIRKLLRTQFNNGIYTAHSSGTIQRWTHATCLRQMLTSAEIEDQSMRNAAFILFDLRNPVAHKFIDEWHGNAMFEDASIPAQSDRTNHRHDQSILSILYYEYGCVSPNHYIGYSIHHDID